MVEFSGLDANLAIARYFGLNGVTLPTLAFDALAQAIAEPDGLKAITTAVEGLYSAREALSPEGLELLRDLVTFVKGRNFYGYATSGRGDEILSVLERIDDGGDAVIEDDPEPEGRFIAPAVEEEASASAIEAPEGKK